MKNCIGYFSFVTYCTFLYRILDESDTLIEVLWNDTMVFYSGYAYKDLESIVEKLCSLVIKSETSKFQVSSNALWLKIALSMCTN